MQPSNSISAIDQHLRERKAHEEGFSAAAVGHNCRFRAETR